MIEQGIIPFEYRKRLDIVMSSSWQIFISQFVNNRHHISTEAPFQHYFADIIKQVGNLYCLTREDVFMVDLETQCKDVKGKRKYVDITCEFVNQISCAVELKFKKASQGAQDHGRIDMYVDIEALELVCSTKFSVGKFYAVTDSPQYVNLSKRSAVANAFTTHHGHITEANKTFWFNSPGREKVIVNLKNSYAFNWQKIGSWYFLELTIQPEKISA